MQLLKNNTSKKLVEKIMDQLLDLIVRKIFHCLSICHKLPKKKILQLVAINGFNFSCHEKNGGNEFLLQTIRFYGEVSVCV